MLYTDSEMIIFRCIISYIMCCNNIMLICFSTNLTWKDGFWKTWVQLTSENLFILNQNSSSFLSLFIQFYLMLWSLVKYIWINGISIFKKMVLSIFYLFVNLFLYYWYLIHYIQWNPVNVNISEVIIHIQNSNKTFPSV